MTGSQADSSPLGLFQEEAELIDFGRWPLPHAGDSGDEPGRGAEAGEKRHTGGKPQHERTAEGKILMTWRSPEWTLGELPKDLQLSPFEALEALQSRQQCPGCGKSQHYYCFNCLKVRAQYSAPVYLCSCAPSIPRAALPEEVEIAFCFSVNVSLRLSLPPQTCTILPVQLW